jgi:hypothetical protein
MRPSQRPTMPAPYRSDTIPAPECYEWEHCSPFCDARTIPSPEMTPEEWEESLLEYASQRDKKSWTIYPPALSNDEIELSEEDFVDDLDIEITLELAS